MGSVARQSALERAIIALGAVEVAPGRYAYKTGARYAIATEAQLEGVAIIGAREWKDRAYDSGQLTLMPIWWAPGRTVICRCECGDTMTRTDALGPYWCEKLHRRVTLRLITANPRTGEEEVSP